MIIPPDLGQIILDETEKVVVKVLIEKMPDIYRYLKSLPRRARKEAFAELKETVESQSVATVIAQLGQRYHLIVGLLAAKSGEGSVAQWRTFIIPRLLVNEESLAEIRSALDNSAEFIRLKDKPEIRAVFFIWLVNEFDKTLSSTIFSPEYPKATGKEWSIIGFDSTFVWGANEWPGHYYVVRKKPEEIERSIRRHRLKDHMTELSGQLGRYSSQEVNAYRQKWGKWIAGRDKDLALVSIPLRADVL